MAHPKLMPAAVRLARGSSGVIKFDLKAADPALHEVLTAASNERVWANFEVAARALVTAEHPPQLAAATLLVPGYIDPDEVAAIARRIAAVDRRIPYSLLGFGPAFAMFDLPRTSLAHAQAAEEAAREAGLTHVHVGNRHLLSRAYDV